MLFDYKDLEVDLLPLHSLLRVNSGRPYGWNDYGLNPNVGFQQYISSGVKTKWKFVTVKFQPEIYFSTNGRFDGFPGDYSDQENLDRFHTLNRGDYPEYFGPGATAKLWWGQSKVAFNYGAFELKISTENFWWGPGQWNALTFSNSAQGFPHISINTMKPAKTFLGEFEAHLLIGSLKDSGLSPLISQELNDIYFKAFNGDFKYLNAFMLSYKPKWISGLTVGFTRTFQVYNGLRGNTFFDWLPVFEGFQKKNFFEDGNTVDFDSNGRDQQVTFFGKYVSKKALAEVYFEYGKRDHNFSWREFVLNPEHARAFIFGFNKLFRISSSDEFIQVRSEITHQQESVNRYIRYRGLKGNNSWHTHFSARGFTNNGQALGVGTGLGSNVQTIEVSKIQGYNKLGVLFERLDHDPDFYYKALFQFTERKPWVDLSLGFLYDKKFDNLLLSSKLQIIHARNYQWQLDPASTPEFPKGENLTSVMAQASLIYFWNKRD
ncbi:capsule assembly Wzi family protein [Algoriphagus namhaensis]|uniref:Capsule assembly Wzi family protein n=1 Tax=Algoriphagus namhaensis TaxID=915353 RepID=A0ABV8ASN6_9BACT